MEHKQNLYHGEIHSEELIRQLVGKTPGDKILLATEFVKNHFQHIIDQAKTGKHVKFYLNIAGNNLMLEMDAELADAVEERCDRISREAKLRYETVLRKLYPGAFDLVLGHVTAAAELQDAQSVELIL